MLISLLNCHLKNVRITTILILLFNFNHIVYADYMVLLYPSIPGLQCLLNVRDMYAKEYDIIYNAQKTKCICIRPKNMLYMCDPFIHVVRQ